VKKIFDGLDFYYEDGMAQIGNMDGGSPYFGSGWCIATIDFILDNLEDGMTFLDVGASFGQFGVIAAKRTSGDVYCVELERETFSVLEKNCAMFSNMHAINATLGDCFKTVTFNSLGFRGSSSIGHGDSKTEVIPLDSLGVKIDFAVIDVEGYETQVLEGGRESFSNTRFMSVEWHKTSGDIDGALTGMGFKIKHHEDNSGSRNVLAWK